MTIRDAKQALAINDGGMVPTGADAVNPRIDMVFRSEASRLHRFFRRRTHSEETAEDLVQEAFLRLIGSPTGRRLDHPLPYLQRIVRNLLIDWSRSSDVRSRTSKVPFDDDGDAVILPEQGHSIETQDLLARYEAALALLPKGTQDIFLLHRVQDLTYKQIAGKLGLAVGTVEYHMGRALAHFDRHLKDQGE